MTKANPSYIVLPEDCPHASYQRGYRQPRDPGMPERSWGHYLPGDEPGWICDIEGQCDNHPDCPLYERS